MTIDVLCKVVDNYGDIGVVHRLARALAESERGLKLRLIVDDLVAYSLLEPAVDTARTIQDMHGWKILSWACPDDGSRAAFRQEYATDPPRIVIECFACGRPDWFEAMLFDPADSAVKTMVNLEYLSAEPYAVEFHRMPSLTRSPLVRKHLFMPGFETGTGGLILDRAFMDSRSRYSDAASRKAERRRLVGRLDLATPAGAVEFAGRFWVLVFGYERDYGRIVGDVAEFGRGTPVQVLVASGKSGPCFMEAWDRAGKPFPATRLPFLPQTDWDEVLVASDFTIVRGEDSMSRAALSGRPFLWQAYPQEGKQQLVKVRALLDGMRRCFEPASFGPVETAFTAFNDRLEDGPEVRGDEGILPLLVPDTVMAAGFSSFSDVLLGNGNLAGNLMTFLREIV